MPPPTPGLSAAAGPLQELLNLRSLTHRQEQELAAADAQITNLTTHYRQAESHRQKLQKQLRSAGSTADAIDY